MQIFDKIVVADDGELMMFQTVYHIGNDSGIDQAIDIVGDLTNWGFIRFGSALPYFQRVILVGD